MEVAKASHHAQEATTRDARIVLYVTDSTARVRSVLPAGRDQDVSVLKSGRDQDVSVLIFGRDGDVSVLPEHISDANGEGNRGKSAFGSHEEASIGETTLDAAGTGSRGEDNSDGSREASSENARVNAAGGGKSGKVVLDETGDASSEMARVVAAGGGGGGQASLGSTAGRIVEKASLGSARTGSDEAGGRGSGKSSVGSAGKGSGGKVVGSLVHVVASLTRDLSLVSGVESGQRFGGTVTKHGGAIDLSLISLIAREVAGGERGEGSGEEGAPSTAVEDAPGGVSRMERGRGGIELPEEIAMGLAELCFDGDSPPRFTLNPEP